MNECQESDFERMAGSESVIVIKDGQQLVVKEWLVVK